MGDPTPRAHLMDPIRIAMRDEKLWRREAAMYAAHRIKLVPCPCKVCKGSKKHMTMSKVENHLMTNGRHHSFRRWKGPGPWDDSANEWDNHIRGGGALFPPLPVDENVGLQRLFHNVNAVHEEVVPPPQECNAPPLGEQNNLPDVMANCEDADFADHILHVVQQTQTMVENVQAQPDSIAEHDRVAADNDASAPFSPPATPEMFEEGTGPRDIPLDVAEDLNLTEVLLSCHPVSPKWCSHVFLNP